MLRWHSSNDWWHKGLIKCSSLAMKACGNTWKVVAFSQLPSPSYHFQALRMSGLINKLCLIFSVTTGCTMKSSPTCNMGIPRILQQSQDMTLFCRSWAKACAAVALKATGQENRCPCQGKREWDLGMLIQPDMGMEIPTVEIPSPQHHEAQARMFATAAAAIALALAVIQLYKPINCLSNLQLKLETEEIRHW